MTEETGIDRWGDPETMRSLLEERARALAMPTVEAVEDDTLAVVVLLIGGERYGIEAKSVEYVDDLQPVTPLPGAPFPWAGIVNLRGSLCPVMDLRSHLGLPDEDGLQRTLIVVRTEGIQLALIADEVIEICHVASGSIRPPLAKDDLTRSIVFGITDDFLSLIDVDQIVELSGSNSAAGGAKNRYMSREAKEGMR